MYDYEVFLSCDWGTTSFRLRLVETRTAAILYEIASPDGIKKIYQCYLDAELSEKERLRFYQDFLIKKIKSLEELAGANLRHIPLVFSGMASSSIGMQELPYGELSVDLHQPNIPYTWIPASDNFPYKTLVISGLKKRNDVMRGEETQILGLSEVMDLDNSLVLIPGTHSKHVHIGKGELIDFQTFMTGEFFALLSKHSILSHSVKRSNPEPDYISFRLGVKEGAQKNLLHAAFKVRTHTLFGNISAQANYYYLSGVLIGSELRELSWGQAQNIYLCGEGFLQNLYNEALVVMGYGDKLRTLSEAEVKEIAIRGQMQFLAHIS